MAQHDKQHIGDNQNKQWWGAKQGLFINALANQRGQVTVDATFRTVINTNTNWAFQAINKGICLFSNYNGASVFQFFYSSSFNFPVAPNLSENFLLFDESPRKSGGLQRSSTQFLHNHANFTTTFPITTSNFNTYNNRVYNYNRIDPSGEPDVLNTYNMYQSGSIFRLNLGARISLGLPLEYYSGTINSLRIYSRNITNKEASDNYHSFTATNRTNLFVEWLFDDLANYYTFGGNLWIKNTGTSGNGLNNGTGYDMQLLGYAGNTPILQSVYP